MPKPLVMAKFSPQGQDTSGFRMTSNFVKNPESPSQVVSSGQTQSSEKQEKGECKYNNTNQFRMCISSVFQAKV